MEKEVVLITGATGLVGKILSPLLTQAGYTVIQLSRSVKNESTFLWDIEKNFIDKRAIEKCHHIVHLAGAGIADKPWTPERKKEIIDSRVQSTDLLIRTCIQQNKELKTVVAASAVGYYGFETSEHIYTESDAAASGFLGETCATWELATDKFTEVTDRIVQLRIGVVLDKNGGALKKMAQPVQFYAGAALGTGKQYMPWIHIYDLCNLILFSLQNKKVQGVYNVVASEFANNKQFTEAIGKALHKPILLPNIPAFIIKALFGELSAMVLEGSRVSNKKILDTGFKFKYDNLDDALGNIFA